MASKCFPGFHKWTATDVPDIDAMMREARMKLPPHVAEGFGMISAMNQINSGNAPMMPAWKCSRCGKTKRRLAKKEDA